jgi:hypothetical protein
MKIVKLLAHAIIVFSLDNCKKDEYGDYIICFIITSNG